MNPLIFALMLNVGINDVDNNIYPIKSPPQVAPLIQKLGDPLYAERERTQLELKKLGYPALRDLRKATNEDTDPEIRIRAREIYNWYLSPTSNDKKDRIPNIWSLPNEIRYPYGISWEKKNGHWGACEPIDCKLDISLEYYILARIIYNKGEKDELKVTEDEWRHDSVCQLATKLYIKNLLIHGIDRNKCIALMDKMADSKTTHKQLYQHQEYKYNGGYGGYYSRSDFFSLPPGPSIEKSMMPEGSPHSHYKEYNSQWPSP